MLILSVCQRIVNILTDCHSEPSAAAKGEDLSRNLA